MRFPASFDVCFSKLCLLLSSSSVGVLAVLSAVIVSAEEVQLQAVTVQGENEPQLGRWLPTVERAQIHSGKKTTVTPVEQMPEIATNNFRQILQHTPGLLTSEVSNQSFSSLSFRGLGDPHETFNLLLLQDGIPIAADPYGYPANYYQPSFDYVDRLEFVRGGAALQYGPQVGGALNFVTRRPNRERPVAIRLKHLGGEDGLYEGYNEISGTRGHHAYLAQYNHREAKGYRSANSDFKVNGGAAKYLWTIDANSEVGVALDLYDADHGEPGGLALTTAANSAGIDGDWSLATLRSDRLRIERQQLAVSYAHRGDQGQELFAQIWGAGMERQSRRQSVGTAPTFGGIANGTTNTISTQEFSTLGAETRYLTDWAGQQTASLGVRYLMIDSPLREERGASATAASGELRKEYGRQTSVLSLTAENRISLGAWSITPGIRLESIHQEIEEKLNSGATVPLRSRQDDDTVPLFGLGVERELPAHLTAYANVSQGYKPVTFSDAVPLSTGDTISTDLKPAKSIGYELGTRGNPWAPLYMDVSVFQYDFVDQFGRVGTNLQNVGRSRHQGADLAMELEQDVAIGRVRLHGNVSLLSAKFKEGPVAGRTPQYSPRYLARSGVVYEHPRWGRLGVLSTFVARHSADDSNTANREIPAYSVWDLNGELDLPVFAEGAPHDARIVFGIANLMDRQYWSRVRSNGIEPAQPRTFHAGVSLAF
ncbi:MAG: TonB-dependent receptor [Bdellovibrionaceae bacterium]|nr:TonB-dependent receptor [Pseudobdellovibrionaceae bacterium]